MHITEIKRIIRDYCKKKIKRKQIEQPKEKDKFL